MGKSACAIDPVLESPGQTHPAIALFNISLWLPIPACPEPLGPGSLLRSHDEVKWLINGSDLNPLVLACRFSFLLRWTSCSILLAAKEHKQIPVKTDSYENRFLRKQSLRKRDQRLRFETLCPPSILFSSQKLAPFSSWLLFLA